MSNKPQDDVPAKFARFLRRTWSGFQEHGSVIGGISGFLSLAGFILAFFAPSVLDMIGSGVLLILASDITHTLLLVALLLLVTMTRPMNDGPVKRPDGGQSDGLVRMGWATFFALVFGALGGTIADRWVVPMMLLGLTVFFILSNE